MDKLISMVPPSIQEKMEAYRRTSTGGFEFRFANGHNVRVEKAHVSTPGGIAEVLALFSYACILPPRVRN